MFRSRLAIQLVFGVLVCLCWAGVAAAGAPTVERPAPYPNYYVGDTGSLVVTTNPPQPNAPVYQFRLKDGQPDGPQPTLVGHTDSSGRYSVSVSIPPGIEGHYTHERFAVGSPSAPQSWPALSFHVRPPIQAPTVARSAPFPTYRTGDVASLVVTTDPVQPNAPVYQFRTKNGQPDGLQPTYVGSTDANGRYEFSAVLPSGLEGNYANERHAVGSVNGPQSSPPLSFSILPALTVQAPNVTRPAPFPSYTVGDTASLTLTTSPVQADQPVYRYRLKNGTPDGPQPTLVGYTDGQGHLTQSVTLPAEVVGLYSKEEYTVGDPDGPRSPAATFIVNPSSTEELTFTSVEPRQLAAGELQIVTLTGTHFTPGTTVAIVDVASQGATGDSSGDDQDDVGSEETFGETSAGLNARVLSVAADGTSMQVEVDARDSQATDTFQLITLDNGLGEKAQPIRLSGAGPIVDAYTPAVVRQGSNYFLAMTGHNLANANVGAPTGVRIQALSQTQDRFSGLLMISATAPTGVFSLTVDANGESITLPLTVVPPSEVASGDANLLAGSGISEKAAEMGLPTPELLLQDLTLSNTANQALASAGEAPSSSGCLVFEGTWSLFDVMFVEPLTINLSTGDVGTILQALHPGTTFDVRAFTLSVTLDVRIHFQWAYCPGFGFQLDLCFDVILTAEVPGGTFEWVRSTCFGTSSDSQPSQGEMTRLDISGGPCANVQSSDFNQGILTAAVTQTACCQQPLTLDSEGQTSGGVVFDITRSIGSTVCALPPQPVDITLTGFIPLDHVRTPLPEPRLFTGDNVLSWQEGDTFRFQQKATVRPALEILSSSIQGGFAERYDASQLIDTPNSCVRQNCPECPSYGLPLPGPLTYEGQCIDPNEEPLAREIVGGLETMRVSNIAVPGPAVQAQLKGALFNPLQFGAPDTDYVIQVKITYDPATGQQHYEIFGDHDGFPAYQIRLNGHIVYEFDTVAAGNTPLAMGGFMDERIGGEQGVVSGPVPTGQNTSEKVDTH